MWTMLVFLLDALLVGSGLFSGLGSAQVYITRSEGGDVLSVSSTEGSCNESCNNTFPTYLVEDRECVNNTFLRQRESCSVQLVSVSDITNHVPTNASGEMMARNSCAITQLSVVRGRNNCTPVNHTGFSVIIGDQICILVNKSNFVYNESEYDGELYHMNISCNSNNMDCVFFKLNGTTDIIRKKFDDTVLPTNLDFCPPSTPPSSSAIISTTSAGPTPTNGMTGGGILDDPILRYTIIGSAGTIGLLVVSITISCAVVCCLALTKPRRHGRPNLTLSHGCHTHELSGGCSKKDTGDMGDTDTGDVACMLSTNPAYGRHMERREAQVVDAENSHYSVVNCAYEKHTTERLHLQSNKQENPERHAPDHRGDSPAYEVINT